MSIEIEHKVGRGRPCKLSMAEKHELRRYREAGVSIARLAAMWKLAPTTVHKILAEMRARLGPEELPADKKHLARRHLFISSGNGSSSTNN
jgi:Helix-turn-helix domain of resolvase